MQNKVSPELISIHIPKTAGTSFAGILKQVYGPENIGTLEIRSQAGAEDPRIIYRDKLISKADFAIDSKVLHGHFPGRRIAEIIKPPANTPIITWLRHPVERVVSSFNYADRIYKDELSITNPRFHILNSLKRNLMEFAHAKGSRNVCADYLKGIQLEDLHFVGIVEHFEEDIAYLAKIMGWKNYKVPHLNRTARQEPLADFKNDAISLWNKKDMDLYEYALELRKRRR